MSDIKKGLAGVVVDTTSVSKVNPDTNSLLYRGYPVQELADKCSFEEVAYLLWYGALPNQSQLDEFNAKLVATRTLPEETEAAITLAAKRMGPMDALRFAVASISATVRDETPDGRAGMVQGIRMVTAIMVPMIVGPFIGAAVISGAGQTYLELGVARPVPGPEIFIAAAIVLVLVPVAVVLRSRVERGMR
jgi:citrate synthase